MRIFFRQQENSLNLKTIQTFIKVIVISKYFFQQFSTDWFHIFLVLYIFFILNYLNTKIRVAKYLANFLVCNLNNSFYIYK